MRLSRRIMGMNVVLDAPGGKVSDLEKVYSYFSKIDERFSPFRELSEVSKINRGEITANDYSPEMKEVLRLSEETKKESAGYFNVWKDGEFNPSGLVKGWAIHGAAGLLRKFGYKDFYVEAGGDIEVGGKNGEGRNWKVGIRNPFCEGTLAEVVCLTNAGIATSGTYLLGEHIYNPHRSTAKSEIVSLTIIGPNVYEADRFATAAFAMGKEGLGFIDSTSGLEGLMIDSVGDVSETAGFGRYRC